MNKFVNILPSENTSYDNVDEKNIDATGRYALLVYLTIILSGTRRIFFGLGKVVLIMF